MLRKNQLVLAWSSQASIASIGTTNGKWKPVPTNIYAMIPFTWIRCLFFLGSMTLYATDVVRSGLGIKSLSSFGHVKVGLDTFISFGPFAYPIQTIRKDFVGEEDTYYAYATDNAGGDDQPVELIGAWPYKFDTVSIAPRALAVELQVEEYPKCLVAAKPPCESEFVSPKTVFTMLNGLFDGVQNRLLNGTNYAAYAVEHEWIDTIEQTIFNRFHDLSNLRYCAVHTYHRNATRGSSLLDSLTLCPPHDPGGDHPAFCNWVQWLVTSALPLRNPSAARDVRVADDIAMRFARFQIENPNLDLEMMLLTASNLQYMQNPGGLYYTWDCQEILVFLRGRKCDLNHQHCETVVVDDYRYERIVLESNVHDLFDHVALIRGIAQAYVWLRMVLLAGGMVVSTWCERHQSLSKFVGIVEVLYISWVNLLKVPIHVVVYGALVPVALYALAHFIDSYMYHLIVQDALSTTLGQDDFLHFEKTSTYVALKMRNIWFIALFCVALVHYDTHYRRHEEWRHRMGIVGFRGTVMGSLSFLTLCFPVRFPSLRRVDIRSVTWHAVNWHLDPLWTAMHPEFSPATTGPFLDTRCLLLAFLACVLLLLFVKALCALVNYPMPHLMDQSTLVPYSAGTLWPTSSLTGYWSTNLDRINRRSTFRRLRSSVMPAIRDRHGREIVVRTSIRIQSLRLENRTPEMWALIRLMNVVMMTNPWVYMRLRLFGVPLYLYRLKRWRASSRELAGCVNPVALDPAIAFLLPERLDRLYEANQLDCVDRFELMHVVNSRSLSWNELIMCG